MRAKDTIRLDTLRGLDAIFLNEMLAAKTTETSLPDDKALAIIRRSVKQRKDSIEQFERGGRSDLAGKEKTELAILEAYLPAMMSRADIENVARKHIEAARAGGTLDPKAIGKLTGVIMRELAGKADGSEVKAVIEALVKA